MFTNRGKALTFDDILLVPSYSEVTPDAVDISTWLTPSIELRIPLLSAAMDTVTESAMAISMARMGGIGIIHKNMPIERQRLEVERVKKSESGMILDPVTVSSRNSVQEALDLMADFRVSGLPVVDDGKLVGILTNRDVRFIEDASAIRVGEVMTSKNLVTVPMGTSLEEAKRHLHEHRIEKLLVVDENERLRGLITMKDIDKVQKYPNACKDSAGRLRVGAAIGIGRDCDERAEQLIQAGVGVPQVTAVMDGSRAAREMDRCCIADGGIKFSGDIVKALVVGAHSVMIGSLFAGTEESPGETILYQGRTYKIYRGMGSIDAMKDGSSDRYFQERSKKLVPEGIVGRVPYRGHVMEAIYQLMGGLRSGMGYVGARTLNDLFENTTFCEISAAGLRESHVHDVIITKEAPNYRIDN